MAKRPLLRGNWVNPAAAIFLSLILSADFYATRAFGEGEGAASGPPASDSAKPPEKTPQPAEKTAEEVKKPAEEAAKEKPEVTTAEPKAEKPQAPVAASKPAPAKPVESRRTRSQRNQKRPKQRPRPRKRKTLRQKPTTPATWRCALPRLTPFTKSAGSARISAISESSPRSRRGNIRCRRMRNSACSLARSAGRARRQARG